jgi:hypothetical protein
VCEVLWTCVESEQTCSRFRLIGPLTCSAICQSFLARVRTQSTLCSHSVHSRESRLCHCVASELSYFFLFFTFSVVQILRWTWTWSLVVLTLSYGRSIAPTALAFGLLCDASHRPHHAARAITIGLSTQIIQSSALRSRKPLDTEANKQYRYPPNRQTMGTWLVAFVSFVAHIRKILASICLFHGLLV